MKGMISKINLHKIVWIVFMRKHTEYYSTNQIEKNNRNNKSNKTEKDNKQWRWRLTARSNESMEMKQNTRAHTHTHTHAVQESVLREIIKSRNVCLFMFLCLTVNINVCMCIVCYTHFYMHSSRELFKKHQHCSMCVYMCLPALTHSVFLYSVPTLLVFVYI